MLVISIYLVDKSSLLTSKNVQNVLPASFWLPLVSLLQCFVTLVEREVLRLLITTFS